LKIEKCYYIYTIILYMFIYLDDSYDLFSIINGAVVVVIV
jgi:hypothetical protein